MKKRTKEIAFPPIDPTEMALPPDNTVYGDPNIIEVDGFSVGDNVSFEPVTGGNKGIIVAFGMEEKSCAYVLMCYEKEYKEKMKGNFIFPFALTELVLLPKTIIVNTERFRHPEVKVATENFSIKIKKLRETHGNEVKGPKMSDIINPMLLANASVDEILAAIILKIPEKAAEKDNLRQQIKGPRRFNLRKSLEKAGKEVPEHLK